MVQKVILWELRRKEKRTTTTPEAVGLGIFIVLFWLTLTIILSGRHYYYKTRKGKQLNPGCPTRNGRPKVPNHVWEQTQVFPTKWYHPRDHLLKTKNKNNKQVIFLGQFWSHKSLLNFFMLLSHFVNTSLHQSPLRHCLRTGTA